MTATGTIGDGTNYGAFGGLPKDLDGEKFSIVESFDVQKSNAGSGSGHSDLNPATASTTVTIEGKSYTFASNNDPANDYNITKEGSQYEVTALTGVTTGSDEQNTASIDMDNVKLSGGTSLSQTATLAVSEDQVLAANFTAVDGSHFTAEGLVTVTLNAQEAPLPLVGSTTGGLAVLLLGGAWGVRRRGSKIV